MIASKSKKLIAGWPAPKSCCANIQANEISVAVGTAQPLRIALSSHGLTLPAALLLLPLPPLASLLLLPLPLPAAAPSTHNSLRFAYHFRKFDI